MEPRADTRSTDDRRWILEALERFEGPLVAYARRRSSDLEAARDAVQETFLRLCRADRAAVEPNLAAWLFTVCRNLTRDAMREERAMVTSEAAATRESPEPGPAASAERSESAERALHTLAGLPEGQREVLRLKFQHGLSYKEIARVTDRSVGTVGFLIHTGIRSLRTRLAEAPRRARGSVEGTTS